MTDSTLEQQIQDKGLTAPRLTLADIHAAIASTEYHVFQGNTLTLCIITLKNGFTVTGESACASPANFDKQIGEQIAFDNAKEKIWLLEGYLLKQRLYEQTF